MDLALLAGLGVFGYLQNQSQRSQYFKSQNNTKLGSLVPSNSGFPNPYPMVNGQASPQIMFPQGSQFNASKEAQMQMYANNYAKNPNESLNAFMQNQQIALNNQYVSRQNQMNQYLQNSQGPQKGLYKKSTPTTVEYFENTPSMPSVEPIMPSVEPIMPSVEPVQTSPMDIYKDMNTGVNKMMSTNDFLLDIPNRSMTDFMNNNMVPNVKKFTQNMAGTGVAQGNYTMDVTVDGGFDKSSPHQSQLDSFTGLSSSYMNKREAGPMFSPAEQQQNYVFGQPVLRPDDERYTVALTKRNDLVPVQPIQVGPGLNTDPSIPATGGFHEFTRILPNNVGDYKANQLEGRINMGKLVTAGLPSAYPGVGGSLNKGTTAGVPKNKPPRDWSQVRLPTMSNKVGFVQNSDYLRGDWQVDQRPNNAQREQISYGYGNVTPNATTRSTGAQNSQNSQDNGPCLSVPDTVGIAPSRPSFNFSNRSPTYMSQDNNIRSKADCNSVPIGNPAGPVKKTGPLLTNYYVNETDRGSVNPMIESPVGIKGQNKGTFYTWKDAPKTTMKETNEFAYVGDPNKAGSKGTFYTWTDAPKTTMKETNEFAYVGDPNKAGSKGTFYTWKDAPKTTMKETNEFAYVGDPNKAGSIGKFYTYTDAPKNTIKQSTNFSYTGTANTGNTTFFETSRFQYTGPGEDSSRMSLRNRSKEKFEDIDYNSMKSTIDKAIGGADTFTIRGTTLVQNYMPGPGRTNIRQDAEDLMGKIDFGTFGSDSNMNGPGTLAQALPNPSRLQNNRFLAVPTANPNKLVGVDDRQLASYQNEQLNSNPLSIFTNKPDAPIPSFYADNEPDNYSDLISSREEDTAKFEADMDESTQQNKKQKEINASLPNLGQNVYPPNGSVYKTDPDNPNTSIVFNEQTENDYNPLISQGSSTKINKPEFSGLAYSGSFNPNQTEYSPSGPVQVYGPTETYREATLGDLGMENGPIRDNGSVQVCEGNPALNFGGNTLMLDRDIR